MLQRLKMAGIMGIINNSEEHVKRAKLPSFLPLSLIFLWLLCSIYSAPILAHDPGLSKVDIELNENKSSVHITYAKKDIELFVNLDNYSKDNNSIDEIAKTKFELTQFINKAIEFDSENKSIDTVINDIHLDNSDAVHFLLTLSSFSAKELTIHSRMIDQFPLGHRQFVKIKTTQGVVNSHLLSVRDASFTSNLPAANIGSIFINFLQEGVWHIWIGFDHILFVLTLLLPSVLVLKQRCWYPKNGLNQVFQYTAKVISAFTVAHSLTLGLTVFELITLPGKIVESMIAGSIIIVALNNIYSWINQRLWIVAFVFGLIHGMGFASVLDEIGMQSNTQAWALIGFNFGVELGQLAIISVVLPLLYIIRKYAFYKLVLFQSGSYGIVLIASIWLFERLTGSSVI